MLTPIKSTIPKQLQGREHEKPQYRIKAKEKEKVKHSENQEENSSSKITSLKRNSQIVEAPSSKPLLKQSVVLKNLAKGQIKQQQDVEKKIELENIPSD